MNSAFRILISISPLLFTMHAGEERTGRCTPYGATSAEPFGPATPCAVVQEGSCWLSRTQWPPHRQGIDYAWRVPSLGMVQAHLAAMVEGQVNETLVQDLSREGGANYLRDLDRQPAATITRTSSQLSPSTKIIQTWSNSAEATLI